MCQKKINISNTTVNSSTTGPLFNHDQIRNTQDKKFANKTSEYTIYLCGKKTEPLKLASITVNSITDMNIFNISLAPYKQQKSSQTKSCLCCLPPLPFLVMSLITSEGHR